MSQLDLLTAIAASEREKVRRKAPLCECGYYMQESSIIYEIPFDYKLRPALQTVTTRYRCPDCNKVKLVTKELKGAKQ